jgi:hypothetical protein
VWAHNLKQNVLPLTIKNVVYKRISSYSLSSKEYNEFFFVQHALSDQSSALRMPSASLPMPTTRQLRKIKENVQLRKSLWLLRKMTEREQQITSSSSKAVRTNDSIHPTLPLIMN